MKVIQNRHLLKLERNPDIKDCYNGVINLINTACLLDPRFKALAFLADNDKKNIIKTVEKEALKIEIAHTSSSSTEASDCDAPSTKKPRKGLMSLLDDVVNCKSKVKTQMYYRDNVIYRDKLSQIIKL